MKKIKNAIIIIVMLICVSNVSLAHSGNITGWKDKDSEYITEYNGKYYGYHKENGVVHYHQVKWDKENKKWVIVTPAVYYDENFNKIENDYNEDANKIEVELVKTVDGDTAKFKMDGEQVTVRFLGINTKETVHPEIGEEEWGKEASDFTKEKCYVLVPFANPDGSVKMQVPISDKGGHLRDMITKEEIQDLIEAIKNQDPVESKTSNLKSQYSNLLNSDSLEDLVRIIKTSYQRNQQRIAQNKRTASIDDEYLHKAEKYLFNEIAASLNISYEEAGQYFKEQVNR